MKSYCIQNLNELKSLLLKMNTEAYLDKSTLLSGNTIGQHIRHILEFYICLMNANEGGVVNYDKRQRDLILETDLNSAINCIDQIIDDLIALNTPLISILQGSFSNFQEELTQIKTSYKRELAYCFEHSIHHQALIKIALKEQNLVHLINQDFGVAPATIINNKNSFAN